MSARTPPRVAYETSGFSNCFRRRGRKRCQPSGILGPMSSATWRSSDAEVHVVETYAVRLRDGRIVRVEEYRTTEQALKAVQGARSE
jgi:hypothetical protein